MSESAAPIQVKYLDHVTLVVKDLQRSREFYADALGMQPIERPSFSFEGSWFQAGTTQIHLILEYEGSGPAGNPLSRERRSSRTHHFAFEVSDAYAAAKQIEALKIPLVSGPKPRPDGVIQVFISDPDGHVVELCSLPHG